ncbi:MAG: c-type cytochrome [Gammaproteobacteria bacterium]
MLRLVLPLFLTLLAPVAALAQAHVPEMDERLLLASPTTIDADPVLLAYMTTLAEPAYRTHCASCHGDDLAGRDGVPNLADYDWLWGITGAEPTSSEPMFEIMQTILYGIRDRDCPDDVKSYGACPDTRYSEMPAYKDLGFTDAQIDDLVQYVLMLSGQDHDAAAVERASANSGLCAECHAADGYGYKPFGGPDLTDSVWLYGGTPQAIRASIADGRLGVCPPWAATLDAATIKALAVYLYRKSQGY